MTAYDVTTKVLDTEIFPRDTITDLNRWHYIYFVQSGEPFTVKGNRHTNVNDLYVNVYVNC